MRLPLKSIDHRVKTVQSWWALAGSEGGFVRGGVWPLLIGSGAVSFIAAAISEITSHLGFIGWLGFAAIGAVTASLVTYFVAKTKEIKARTSELRKLSGLGVRLQNVFLTKFDEADGTIMSANVLIWNSQKTFIVKLSIENFTDVENPMKGIQFSHPLIMYKDGNKFGLTEETCWENTMPEISERPVETNIAFYIAIPPDKISTKSDWQITVEDSYGNTATSTHNLGDYPSVKPSPEFFRF